MRLAILDHGHALPKKMILALIRLFTREAPVDMLKLMFYRPEFFANAAGPLHHSVLRGPSQWTIGEREFMATFVSEKNQCRFCVSVHRAVAQRALGRDLPEHSLEGAASSVSPRLRAILPFLEKLALTPELVGGADVAPLIEAGISREQIVDAINICAIFCQMNRLADAVGCAPASGRQAALCAKMLLKRGYKR
jgi:uncharacterized peroxidase-related enzyme